MASLKGDGSSFFQILVGALITLAFIGIIATAIIGSTTTEQQTNFTVAVPSDGEATDLFGRELIDIIEIYNETDEDMLQENVTLRTAVSATTGLLTVQIYNNGTDSIYNGDDANVSYTLKPDGYLNLAGARGVHALTIIISALAILVFIIVVLIKTGSLGELIGRK